MKHTFGTWVKEQRELKGLSQERLAEAVGMDRAYINKLERDRIRYPVPETRERFHSVFGTSEDDLQRAGIEVSPGRGIQPRGPEPTDRILEVADEDAPLTPDEEAVLARISFMGLQTLSNAQLREIIRVVTEGQ